MRGRRVSARLGWPAAALSATIAVYACFPLLTRMFGVPPPNGPLADAARLAVGVGSYFACAWFSSRLLSGLLRRLSGNEQRMPRLLEELIGVSFFVIALVASIVLVSGQSMAGAVASSGLAVAVLGFALRNVIADVFSGMAVGIERPYQIGDWVDITGIAKGRIMEIGWRTTRLLTVDHAHMILPNSQIARQQLVNYSRPRPSYRAHLRLTLDHVIGVTDAKRMLRDALHSAHTIMREPRADVRAVAYDASGITYDIRYWVPNFALELDCRDAVLSAVDDALRNRGLPPPRARTLVSVQQSGQGDVLNYGG